MKLLYVGRLDTEKGRSAILTTLSTLIQHHRVFTIDIYGSGQYSDHITTLAQQYPDFITYHGRTHKSDIQPYRSEYDFFLMPSTFLETFGLTACESLLCQVPVIGYAKGGLIPFIHPTLDLTTYPGDDTATQLTNCITHLITHNITKQSLLTQMIFDPSDYSIATRRDQIQPLITSPLMIISDFVNYNGGGVETHIHDSIQILNDHKITTHLYGHQAPKGKRSSIIKLIRIATNPLNIIDAILIKKHYQKTQSQHTRIHSISRIIGRRSIALLSQGDHIMTHHELGLFHPYPSRTTDVSQLPSARSLRSFIHAGHTKNPLTIIAIIGKYMINRLLHKQLQKKVKTHIVPSPRMIPIVQSRYPDADVVCIPHFVHLT